MKQKLKNLWNYFTTYEKIWFISITVLAFVFAIREPYAIYYQGGLTWAHAKLGILMSLQKMCDAGLITLPEA